MVNLRYSAGFVNCWLTTCEFNDKHHSLFLFGQWCGDGCHDGHKGAAARVRGLRTQMAASRASALLVDYQDVMDVRAPSKGSAIGQDANEPAELEVSSGDINAKEMNAMDVDVMAVTAPSKGSAPGEDATEAAELEVSSEDITAKEMNAMAVDVMDVTAPSKGSAPSQDAAEPAELEVSSEDIIAKDMSAMDVVVSEGQDVVQNVSIIAVDTVVPSEGRFLYNAFIVHELNESHCRLLSNFTIHHIRTCNF